MSKSADVAVVGAGIVDARCPRDAGVRRHGIHPKAAQTAGYEVTIASEIVTAERNLPA